MFASIQSFFCLNPNLNDSTNSETNSKGLTERSVNSELVAEWVVNPDSIVSAIYTATEREAAFPREIVNLVTEYLQNHEVLKSLSMFGPADWKTTFNKKVEMIQPPPEMDAFLQKINPFTGKLNAESCLCVFIPSHYQDIPRNTKEEQELVNHPLIPLTPATMEELAKNPFYIENQTKFTCFLNTEPHQYLTKNKLKEARKEFLNLHAKKSYWVVITRTVIPDSLEKSFSAQKDFINKKRAKDYWQVPSIREATICTFAHYAKTGFALFNNPWMYTRCVEQIKGFQIIIGGFSMGSDLKVYYSSNDASIHIGIIGLKKFAF